MVGDLMSFSTVFQSYQDNERLIMIDYVQWNPVHVEKNLPQAGLKLGADRSPSQCLTY